MKGISRGLAVAGLVVAVGCGITPAVAYGSAVEDAGVTANLAGVFASTEIARVYAPAPVWAGEPEPIVTVKGGVGVGTSDVQTETEPIVTVKTAVGVTANDALVENTPIPSTPVDVTPAESAAPSTPVTPTVPASPVVATVPVEVPASDEAPVAPVETVAPSVGVVGDASVVIRDSETGETTQLSEVFECWVGGTLVKIAYDVNGCDDVFASTTDGVAIVRLTLTTG